MTISSTFDFPCKLIGTFLKLGTAVWWEVDGIASFVIATFDVITSFWLLLDTIWILLWYTLIASRAEFFSIWTRLFSSNSMATRNIFGTGLSNDNFCFSCWWTQYCPCWRIRIKNCIRWKLRHRFHWLSFSCCRRSTIFNAKWFTSPRDENRCKYAVKLVFFKINACDESRTVPCVGINVQSIFVRWRTKSSFTRSQRHQKAQYKNHVCNHFFFNLMQARFRSGMTRNKWKKMSWVGGFYFVSQTTIRKENLFYFDNDFFTAIKQHSEARARKINIKSCAGKVCLVHWQNEKILGAHLTAAGESRLKLFRDKWVIANSRRNF